MSTATRCTRPALVSARRQAHKPAARRCSVRPELERLESRLVLDISIRFVGGRPGLQPPLMDPSEVAGAVPDANWNNATGNFQPVSGPLNDQNGNPVDGTTMGYGGSPSTWAREDGGIPDAPGDSRMMEGYLDTDTTSITVVQVNGLSQFAPYDVYLYFSGDTHNGRHGYYTVVNAGTQSGTDLAPFDGSTYTQDVQDGNGGNYVLFTGVSGYQLLILVSAQSPDNFDNGTRAPLNAIQIVPEAGPHGHHAIHLAAPLVGGLPTLGHAPTSPWTPPSAPAPSGGESVGSVGTGRLNALFATPAAQDAALALPPQVGTAQADAVFANPVLSAF